MRVNEDKVCEECGKPYKPRVFGEQEEFAKDFQKNMLPEASDVWLSDCDCASRRWAAERLAEDQKESRERGLRRFAKLEMGPYTKYESIAPYPKGLSWEDPFSAVRNHKKLIIQGPVGSRKSTLARKIAANLLVNNHLVVGGYVPRLLVKLKSFNNDDEQSDTYQWLHMGEVLLLDDLDKILGSRFEVEHLLMLVDYYNNQGRSIIATMNASFDEFIQEVTSNKYQVNPNLVTSMVSRLKSGADILITKGDDLRTPGQTGVYDAQ